MGAFVEKIMGWLAKVATLSTSVDYISALPDDLLREIVSRLPIKDAARAAAVASQWYHIWRTTPLVLASDLLPSAVARVLADHPGPFRVLDISRCRFASQDPELERWMRLLAAKGIKELFLVNDVVGLTADPVRLPTDILRCASLRRLYLGYFTFPDTTGLPRGAGVLPKLEELRLLTARISQWDLDYVLACSPVLEKVSFLFKATPNLIHFRSKSLKCVLLWDFVAEEIAVVDTPLLERLFFLEAPRRVGDEGTVVIKIACAPKLRVLGFLDTEFHWLQIGDTVIMPGTVPSTSTVVPSVKILALRVNFGVLEEVEMLVTFLRCFPNIDTLHIESFTEATGRNHAKFWQEVSTVECIKSHVKKIVIHEYGGDQSELAFLKFISRSSQELQTLHVLLHIEVLTLGGMLTEVTTQLLDLRREEWSCDCNMVVLGPKLFDDWSIDKALDLSVRDPFHW